MNQNGLNTALAAEKPQRRLRALPLQLGLAMAECTYVRDRMAAPHERLAAMIEGIRKYQDHPFVRMIDPLPVVWQKGGVTLSLCAAQGAGQKASAGRGIVLVPSLINRSHILDLLAEKSFTRWLAGQGIDVYLLDWGAPAQDKGLSSMTDVVNGALVPALEYAAARHTQGRFHALGYCMGGTLLAAALLQTGAAISSAVFLASPWDFHAGDRILADQVRVGTPAAIQMFERSDVLPVSWIQSVFAAVNADRAMRKFSEFALMDQDSPRARLFVAVEDWLNDGVDLPRDIALSCIRGWYGENGPARREWQAGGRVVDATKIDIPALVVAAARDRLVPAESALALGDVLPRCTVMLPDCGHIGMMTGTKAQQTVWEPVRDWMCQH